MKGRILRGILLSLSLGLFFLAPVSLTLSGLIHSGSQALEEWRYQEALEIAVKVEEMVEKESDPARKAEAYSFLGWCWFYRGDYQRALEMLNQFRELKPKTSAGFEKFYERVQYLAGLFSKAQEKSSAHFIIRWLDPRDEVLAEPGLEVLEQAYSALKKEFNHSPQGEKILVEIYPRPQDLAIAVGLEEKMIKDSGTVAICKFRRLMITSPRALLFGYDYLTTLSHELVHFFIYSKTGEVVPIWLHEGLAKYTELIYKNKLGELDPVPKSLLVSALKNNELISFDRMSPTFAQFKNPKQGQLAFAEVSTMVAYLKEKCGSDSWLQIFEGLKQGKKDREALKEVCGEDFSLIWENWKKWVRAKGWQEIPSAVVMKMEFKEQESGEEEEEEEAPEEGKAWEYVRLGDLLRDRGFYQSAVVEYQKAISYEPYDPKILNKLGRGQILAKDYKSAIGTLSKSAELYPEYSTTFVNLGLAYLSAGEEQKALLAYQRALELNPFNPVPYQRLAELYLKNGERAKAEQMETRLALIKGARR